MAESKRSVELKAQLADAMLASPVHTAARYGQLLTRDGTYCIAEAAIMGHAVSVVGKIGEEKKLSAELAKNGAKAKDIVVNQVTVSSNAFTGEKQYAFSLPEATFVKRREKQIS